MALLASLNSLSSLERFFLALPFSASTYGFDISTPPLDGSKWGHGVQGVIYTPALPKGEFRPRRRTMYREMHTIRGLLGSGDGAFERHDGGVAYLPVGLAPTPLIVIRSNRFDSTRHISTGGYDDPPWLIRVEIAHFSMSSWSGLSDCHYADHYRAQILHIQGYPHPHLGGNPPLAVVKVGIEDIYRAATVYWQPYKRMVIGHYGVRRHGDKGRSNHGFFLERADSPQTERVHI